MRIFPALTSIALGATALVAALALSTPAGACFVVGPGPTFTVPSFPNSSLSPPCPPPAGAFSTFAAAVAFSNAQLALLSPSPVSPSPVSPFPAGPGGPLSPSFPFAPDSGNGFSNAADAFNFGNAAPGHDFGGDDFAYAAMHSGFGARFGDPDDADGDGIADGIVPPRFDLRGRPGPIPGSNVGWNDENDDGLPDNDQDADGYDDNTGEFLYSTLVEDIDRNRDGVIDADQNPACSGGACDVGGFLDDLSGVSCSGGSCDVGDIFSAPTFGGGVRVAVGDVDGDGVSDIITGAPPGGGAFDITGDVTWTSRNPSIATVSNADATRGQVTTGGTSSDQRILDFSIIFDEVEDFDRSIRGESLPGNLPNSTLAGNTAGGGIVIAPVPLTIENTTISGNTAGGPPMTGGNINPMTGEGTGPMTGGNINPMTGEGTDGMSGGNTNVPEVQLTDAQWQGVINGTLKITNAGAVVPR